MAKKPKAISMEEKVNYLRIGLALQKIGVDNRIAEAIILTYEKLMEKGGETDLLDVSRIEAAMEEKYSPKKEEA